MSDELLTEVELLGLEGAPDQLYSYALVRKAAVELRTARARIAALEAALDNLLFTIQTTGIDSRHAAQMQYLEAAVKTARTALAKIEEKSDV